MKQSRHAKIIELIKSNVIETQEALATSLKEQGFDVTQATVSRDIKELRLIKTLTDKGVYKYDISESSLGFDDLTAKYYNMLTHSVISAVSINNMVILKCYTGTAQSACVGVDALKFTGIAGTIAGDDTVLIITLSDDYALNVEKDINNIIS